MNMRKLGGCANLGLECGDRWREEVSAALGDNKFHGQARASFLRLRVKPYN